MPVEIMKNLFKQTDAKCKKAKNQLDEALKEYEHDKKYYCFDDEACLVEDSRIEYERAKARLDALVELKIDIEIAYKKIKRSKENVQ